MKVLTDCIFDWATCKLESCASVREYEGPITQCKSSSKQSQQTTQTTVNTSRNLNIQDVEGLTVGEAGGDVTIVQTDQGAFGDAASLAERAVSVGEALGEDALQLARDVSEGSADLARDTATEISNVSGKALAFGDRAFGTVEKALGEVSGAYQDSASYQAKALSTVGDLFEDAFTGIRDFVGEVTERSQTSLGNTVTALNTIAREQSKSTDERVAEVSQSAIKYIVIAVGIIAAVVVFKKG